MINTINSGATESNDQEKIDYYNALDQAIQDKLDRMESINSQIDVQNTNSETSDKIKPI